MIVLFIFLVIAAITSMGSTILWLTQRSYTVRYRLRWEQANKLLQNAISSGEVKPFAGNVLLGEKAGSPPAKTPETENISRAKKGKRYDNFSDDNRLKIAIERANRREKISDELITGINTEPKLKLRRKINTANPVEYYGTADELITILKEFPNP